MAKRMKGLALVFTTAAALAFLVYCRQQTGFWQAAAITAATCAYHFAMRLAVGGFYDLLLHNRVDYRLWWFRPRCFEPKLYTALGVKGWKKHLPTYDPNTFSPKLHSWQEIAMATCQSELVHETIMLLSFVPLLAIGRYGAAAVFIITSAAAALFDSLFVVVQRFNRFRLVKLIEKAA